MPDGGARAFTEARFGPPGGGRRELTIAGLTLGLSEVTSRRGLALEGCRTIDGFELGPARFAIRRHDPEAQRVVTHGLDEAFRYPGETRAHVGEWVGDEALAAGEIDIVSWTSR